MVSDGLALGLDPVTRRQIWAILHRAKKGRAIVLTTHSMDEAELLCNRIGIVALGVMRCLGNQLHLKNKFGEGYNLKINFDPEYEPQVIKFITDNFPAANLTGDFRGSHFVSLCKQKSRTVLSELAVYRHP
jgi:ABC-type multidrug transport system ATPase subunit